MTRPAADPPETCPECAHDVAAHDYRHTQATHWCHVGAHWCDMAPQAADTTGGE